MKSLDDIQSQNPEQGFQFPGAFEVTVLGKAHAGLDEEVPAIIVGLGLAVLTGSLRTRPSNEGHYMSVSVTFTCPSREKYEAVHAALRAHHAVKWTI
ncbi:MAG: DUF493 family protein [Rudaea sp.]